MDVVGDAETRKTSTTTTAPSPSAPNPTAYVDEIEHLGFPIFFAELELLVSRLKRQAKEEEATSASPAAATGAPPPPPAPRPALCPSSSESDDDPPGLAALRTLQSLHASLSSNPPSATVVPFQRACEECLLSLLLLILSLSCF